MSFVRKNSMLIVAGVLLVSSGLLMAEAVPGVVVSYADPNNGVYLASPSIAVLPNGDYVVSHDTYPGVILTHLFRSSDKGATWEHLINVPNQYESTLFVHDGVLYMIGGYIDTSSGSNDYYVAIRKSLDGGLTWTDASDGFLTPPASSAYNCAPVPVLEYNGRIWRAIEQAVDVGGNTEYMEYVLSAPADSDLMDGANWTKSNGLLMSDYMPGNTWMEGNVAAAPNGGVQDILRVAGMTDKAAVIQVSADGTTLSFDPQTIIDFPGGASKFTIRYDRRSGKYWSLVNKQTDPTAVRNRLVMTSSTDLVNWVVEGVILENPNSTEIGFQYADWQVVGDNIVFVSRTAFGGSGFFHDAEFITFHRIPYFRLFHQSTISVINCSGDTEIDQHINYKAKNLGAETSIRVEVRSAVYTDPVISPESQGLIKWDVSSIPSTDIVTYAELQLQQSDGAVESCDVYAIDEGVWDEMTVTWDSWQAAGNSESLLGNMPNITISKGLTTFTNDDLTELVQLWHNGGHDNLGLLFKWAGVVGQGDTYLSKEHTGDYIAPRLVVQHISDLLFASVIGSVELSGYTGDLQDAGIRVDIRENGVEARREALLLGPGGGFAIDRIPLGTYDVTISAFGYLPKTLTGVDVSSDPIDLGTIVLDAGDLNGDSFVDMLDFAILANNWLSFGQP